MNELIQALGNYTEALENKISELEAKVAALEERIEELEIKQPEIPEISEEPVVADPEIPAEPVVAKPVVAEPEIPAEPAEPEPVKEPEIQEKPVVPEPVKEQEAKPEQQELFICDIRKVISLGDRFLFQRELFGQNGEAMQRTLDIINHCSSEQDAFSYVEQNFNWDKKSPTYELFINAIRRTYSGR